MNKLSESCGVVIEEAKKKEWFYNGLVASVKNSLANKKNKTDSELAESIILQLIGD